MKNETFRKCPKCKDEKLLCEANFHKAGNKSGFVYYCKKCVNVKKYVSEDDIIPPSQAEKIRLLKASLPFLFRAKRCVKKITEFDKKLKFYEPK